MYAIIRSGNQQYRVAKGETVEVGRINAKIGDEIKFDQVLMLGGDQTLVVPAELSGASVSAKVVGHTRGKKALGMKYKPKKHYRRKVGNRAALTRLQIMDIVVP